MTSYTLSLAEVYAFAFLFSSILTIISVVGVQCCGKDSKRLSWVISVVNSFVMTVLGAYYLFFKISSDPDFFRMIPENVIHFEDRTDFTVLVCLWFALANIFDIGVGLVFYPKQLGLLTAYIHHSAFIWIMWTSTTGNGLFITLKPFSPAFCNMLIEELPTFLLALGSLSAQFRTDLGFGVTFFLLRIVYHLYFLVYAIRIQVQTTEIVLYFLTTLLHVNWFATWVTKYGSKALKGGLSEKKSI